MKFHDCHYANISGSWGACGSNCQIPSGPDGNGNVRPNPRPTNPGPGDPPSDNESFNPGLPSGPGSNVSPSSPTNPGSPEGNIYYIHPCENGFINLLLIIVS